MTRETIISAIHNGAKSLADIARTHDMSTGGSTNKKIKAFVPNIKELIAGEVEAPAIPQCSKLAEDSKSPKSSKSSVVPEKAKVVGNPYNQTDASISLYAEVFNESTKPEKIEDFVSRCSEKFNRSKETIQAFIGVMSDSTNHRNNGRSLNNAKAGKVHLIAA